MSTVQPGLVVYAKHKQRVSAFYQQTLGLGVHSTDSSYDLLRGPGIELVIHRIPPEIAADIAISEPPTPREDTPLKPIFAVPCLDAVRRAAEATGGFLKPADQAWHFGGHVVLDGCDPEGNVLQFRQPQAA